MEITLGHIYRWHATIEKCKNSAHLQDDVVVYNIMTHFSQ